MDILQRYNRGIVVSRKQYARVAPSAEFDRAANSNVSNILPARDQIGFP